MTAVKVDVGVLEALAPLGFGLREYARRIASHGTDNVTLRTRDPEDNAAGMSLMSRRLSPQAR